MKFLPFILLFLITAGEAISQNTTITDDKSKGFVLNHEWSIGARLISNGWSVFGEKSKFINVKKSWFIQTDLSELRSFKQKRTPSLYSSSRVVSELESPRDYHFGKINSFYTLRAGFGYRRIIAEKAEKNGVRLSISYMGGFSLGILKPYFLYLLYPIQDSDPNFDTYLVLNQSYSDRNEEKFLDNESIYGASGFRWGWREIEPVPGAFARASLHFDFSSKDQMVKALDAGFQIEGFYKKIEMIAEESPRRLFFSAYIGFQVGRRIRK